MQRHQGLGIVLRRWPYSETSLALHVLTPEHGVVPLLAKGANRIKGGQLGNLDTWALVELEYGGPDRAEMLSLYRSRLVTRFGGISRSRRSLAAAGLLAELAEHSAPPGPEAGASFLWLLRSLRELDAGTGLDGFLIRGILQGLALLGIQPDVEPEGVDFERLPGRIWFDIAQGRLLGPEAPAPQQTGRRLSAEGARLLRAQRRSEAIEAGAPTVRREVLTILGEFLAYHLERPPRAWRFLFERPRRRATS